MNHTGYGEKSATIVKAVLYNLLPPKSVIVAPDSIWASDFWAGMFLSAALRGCLVFPIAPGKEQAPSDASITLEAVRQSLTCMVAASQKLNNEIKTAGGVLQVGLYKCKDNVQHVGSKLASYNDSISNGESLTNLFSVRSEIVDLIESERLVWENGNAKITQLAGWEESEAPKLHLKAQFFANREALRFLQDSIWVGALNRYFELRRKQISGDTQIENGVSPSAFGEKFLSAWSSYSTNRSIVYMTVGSHNQDRRSMMLDGEALVLVSGFESIVGAIDFAMLMGSAHWVGSKEELTTEFSEQKSLVKSILGWIKDLI
jgi:hypothetical protein